MSSSVDGSRAEAPLSEMEGGRPARVPARTYVPDAEQRGSARAARRTLPMMRWSRMAERAALVKDSKEGNRGGRVGNGSEGT